MTLDQIFEHGKQAAKHLFREQGMIHPMWVCECENGQIIPICIQVPDRGKRDAFASALKGTFAHHRVVRYVAMLESWVLEMPEDTNLAKRDFSQSLEHHPDRREVIFIQAEDKDGTQKAGQYCILRPEHGKPSLSEFKDFRQSATQNEGRFARLLNTEE